MEPSVSVPMLTGAKPAATPMALPDDEPQGVLRKKKYKVRPHQPMFLRICCF